MIIFNTLTRKKETFVPLEEGKVKMYVCGPTVYDYIHLGNARPLVCFDILRRYFEHLGYEVTFVQNFTDIDDKLIHRAAREDKTVPEIAEHFIAAYLEDSQNLGVKMPDIAPRATKSMDSIRDMIQALLDKNYAYIGSDAVYYDVSKNSRYGRLSGHSLESLQTGERDQAYFAEGKEAVEDFALWKFKRGNEPSWDGPGGEGRPGWHIECSAMIRENLGETIDIHAGGQDLIFPHHENEIAQSEVLHDAPLANYWMHNAYINIDGVKLSKSLGNSIKLRDLAADWTYPVLRFFIAQANYRSALNVDDDSLLAAKQALERVKNAVSRIKFLLEQPEELAEDSAVERAFEYVKTQEQAIYQAMDDDLNTADALSEAFILIHTFNQNENDPAYRSHRVLKRILELLTEFFSILGLDLAVEDEIPSDVIALLAQRADAREAKDWAKSDEIRDMIRDLGFDVRDTAEGQQCTPLTA